MNIESAKEQIKSTVKAYIEKDKYNQPVIPIEKQRPIFLIGPPGVGKTAIVNQVAAELRIGFNAYSMTHHTRQSALGLPFIVHKGYKGEEYPVTEYTMSEIVSDTYEYIEAGYENGILFLDELNCVSETLSPVMLQLLQQKKFGKHSIPQGWVIVAAGNPPQYNNSVHEMDIVTWDRIKRIDVEEDWKTWKEYAIQTGVHPAIISYLETKPEYFYSLETTPEGKRFVTARGWDDLSSIIRSYERLKNPVDKDLIVQYVQNSKIASDFSNYYDLYKRYKDDYKIEAILDGQYTDQEYKSVISRASRASFDIVVSIVSIFSDIIIRDCKEIILKNGALAEIRKTFDDVSIESKKSRAETLNCLNDIVNDKNKAITAGSKSGSVTRTELEKMRMAVYMIEEIIKKVANSQTDTDVYSVVRAAHNENVNALRVLADKTLSKTINAIKFVEEAYKAGSNYMTMFITSLTVSYYSATFLARHHCQPYVDHSQGVNVHARSKLINAQLSTISQLEIK